MYEPEQPAKYLDLHQFDVVIEDLWEQHSVSCSSTFMIQNCLGDWDLDAVLYTPHLVRSMSLKVSIYEDCVSRKKAGFKK